MFLPDTVTSMASSSVPRLVTGRGACCSLRCRQRFRCTSSYRADLWRSLSPESSVPIRGSPWMDAGSGGCAVSVPIPPSADGDILDALRPACGRRDRHLKGASGLERQTWLTASPPDHPAPWRQPAPSIADSNRWACGVRSPDGATTVCMDGIVLAHIPCGVIQRFPDVFEIRPGAEEWEPWDAYAWSLGELGAESAYTRPPFAGPSSPTG